MNVIDPLLLGRPLRALESIAAELAGAVEHSIAGSGRREIVVLVTQPRLLPAPPRSEPAGLAVTLERQSVLDYMALRHGLAATEAAAPAATATERRLGGRLRDSLARATEDTLMELAPAAATQAEDAAPLRAGETRWAWRAQLALGDGAPHALEIVLDTLCSRRLERAIAARRPQAGRGSESRAEPAEAVLQMALSARLVEMTITAADLQALKPGTVLPIVMGRAVTLINGAPLLRATVAEQQGKLHLTAFDTLD